MACKIPPSLSFLREENSSLEDNRVSLSLSLLFSPHIRDAKLTLAAAERKIRRRRDSRTYVPNLRRERENLFDRCVRPRLT